MSSLKLNEVLMLNYVPYILGEYGLDLTAYNDELVHRIIDDIKVLDQDKLMVVFHGGIEIEQEIQ